MFITLEGVDGCGKSTQAERLYHWLCVHSERGVLKTFEPGGWPGGSVFRQYVLGSKNHSPLTELLLFLADRSEHVASVIAPMIEEGHHVVCERWNESTLAYQAGAHKLPVDDVRKLIAACKFPEPDLKIFLDVPPELALSRITSRGKTDKFEAEGISLMRKVASFYRGLADDGELVRIDCEQLSEDEVFAAIISEITRSEAWQSR